MIIHITCLPQTNAQTFGLIVETILLHQLQCQASQLCVGTVQSGKHRCILAKILLHTCCILLLCHVLRLKFFNRGSLKRITCIRFRFFYLGQKKIISCVCDLLLISQNSELNFIHTKYKRLLLTVLRVVVAYSGMNDFHLSWLQSSKQRIISLSQKTILDKIAKHNL